MVLGLKTKKKTRVSDQDHYIVSVKEISPWSPLQALPLPQSILLQWDNSNKNSGSLVFCNRNGKIEFGKSFRLPVTLSPESSHKSSHCDRFPKNWLEFYLYEPRRDKNAKGHLLGSAVVNLADYGIIRETISISTPINLKKSSKIRLADQPILYFNIRPFDKGSSSSLQGGSSPKELSFDKDGSSSVSESINVETESAPLTDDDLSSQSYRTVASSVSDPPRESHGQHDKIGSEPVDGGITRPGHALPSDGTSSNPGNLVTHPTGKVSSSEACVAIPVDMNSDHVKDKDSQSKTEGAGKAWRYDQSNVDRNSSSNSLAGHWKENAEKSSCEDELDSQILGPEEYSLQDRLGLRQKSLKPVQLHVDEAKSNGPSKIQFMEKAEDNSFPEKAYNGTTSDILGEKEETEYSFSNSKVDSVYSYGLLKKTQVKEKAKENDVSDEIHDSPKEAAVLEASLYSVVAEHGGSTNKDHAPARRLSRFYLHACSANSQDKRASAARAAISGLVLVSKACGNDVPRLTFWLSNPIVLRATVSHTIGEMQSSRSRKTSSRKHGLGDQEQENFSFELWKEAFKDACGRLCPVRACGHECGRLAVLAKLVMEQLVGRLDVAMFNAILRESDDEMPTDPISDPIPAGRSSFGAGVLLKNSASVKMLYVRVPKAFSLLNALSDLMMLPSEMLVDRSTRKEVCPKFSVPLIIRVLNNFVADEFNPNSVSQAVFEALEEDLSEAGEESITNFPCMATPIAYSPPSATSLTDIIGKSSHGTESIICA
ncbi:Thioredoxin O2, putative isoform 1 [Hibiscus syriacus]|uniref:Thioredoxin O2, putative isoform 1 n=1 Tax=Hibiscus syriacus TaxID=106335 RepID=A0A6A3A4V9_HIBSY|nr:Thioredoxin O2, putative isoform 1 [Hibiscus syriacus]